jgi:hypothetical protein
MLDVWYMIYALFGTEIRILRGTCARCVATPRGHIQEWHSLIIEMSPPRASDECFSYSSEQALSSNITIQKLLASAVYVKRD